MILMVDDDVELLQSNQIGLEYKLPGRVIVSLVCPIKMLEFVQDTVERGHGWAIAILVTDYHMPGMNGVQLATAVRELLPDLPVLFHCGEFQPEMREFDNCLFRQKGCSIRDLVDDILELVL